MNIRLYCGAALCAVLAWPCLASDEVIEDVTEVLPVASDEIEEYRVAGDWVVFANNTRGNCFMTKSDDSGAVQMGLTKSGEYGYVGAFVKGAEIEEGPKAIAISVNGNLYFGESNSATQLSDGYNGGYILSNNIKLRYDLGKADEMYLFPDAPYSATVNLKDARKAIFEVQECTKKLQSG
ncbi:MAG: hypothetical protein AAGB07_05665 [Pseudomonadota bacterium]